jgi:hypothetical protein
MQAWVDQEEQKRDRFLKCGNNYYYNKNKRGNNHRNDRSQQDHLGSSQKRKSDDLIAAIECPSRGKKSGTMQEQFDKLLHKQCLVHPNAMHLAIKCYNLQKIFNTPHLDKNAIKKGKEKEDDELEDKSDGAQFQDASKTINVIFGIESSFASKQAQKLALCEILFIEPAVPQPLQWLEVPISFSRDDQWTSFSELEN